MENKSPAKRGLKTDNKGTKRDGGNALRAADLSPICCASATLSILHRPRPNSARGGGDTLLCSWPWGEGEAAMVVGIARIAPGPFLSGTGGRSLQLNRESKVSAKLNRD